MIRQMSMFTMIIAGGLSAAACQGRGDYGNMGPGMGPHHGYYFGGGGLIVGIVGIVVIVVLIIAAWYFFSRGGGKGMISSNETALDVLKKRYARGEISREQLEEMKRDIQDGE
jgi:putative membrane protein